MRSFFELIPIGSSPGTSEGLAVDVLLKSTLLLALAALVWLALRRGSASLRHLVWVLAMIGTLAMLPLTIALPAWRLPILPATSGQTASLEIERPSPALPIAANLERFPVVENPEPVATLKTAPASAETPSQPVAGPAFSTVKNLNSWTFWIASAWASGVVAVLSPMVVGLGGLWLKKRRGSRAAEDSWLELSDRLRSSLGISRSVAMLRDEGTASPMTWGVFRPVILLPSTAETWPGDRLRDVILHELAHVKRWDCLTQVVARVACAVYWFHPLAWVASRRLLVERELACDDLVIRSGARPTDYAGHLLEVARTSRPTSGLLVAAAVPMARRSQIEGRLVAILDGSRDRRGVSLRGGFLAFGTILALILPLSASRLAARPPRLIKATKAATKTDQPATMIVSGRVLDPDGKPVSGANVGIVGRRRLAALGARAEDQSEALGLGESGGDGSFRIEVPRTSSVTHYEVQAMASSPGFGLGWAELNRDAASPAADLRLRPERVVEGRLVDLQGSPAPGVSVRVYSVGVRKPDVGGFDGLNFFKAEAPIGIKSNWPTPVTTDDDGRFRLSGIGRSVGVGLRVEDPRHARQYLRIETEAGEGPKRITLSLKPAMQVTGRVTCADTGEPIRDAIVVVGTGSNTFGSERSEYRTDADGHYSANPAPGKFLGVTVYPPIGSPYLIYGRSLQDDEGKTMQVVDMKVPRGTLISGTISGGGKPLVGASVYYDNGESNIIEKEGTIPGWMSAVPSGPDGRYAIAVAPGKGNLVAYGPTSDFVHVMKGERELRSAGKTGGRRLYAHAFVPYEAKAGTDAPGTNFPLQPGVTVKGRVEGPEGQTVDEAEIVTTLSISPFHTFWRGDFTLPVRDGRFEIHGVPPDRRVKCSFLDAKNGWGTTIDIDSDSAANGPLVVKLQRSGSVKARIIDEQGVPYPNGVLNLHIVGSPGPGTDYSGESKTAEEKTMLAADEEIYTNVDRRNYWNLTRTDAEGRVTLGSLIPGATYRIYEYTPDRGKSAFRWRDFVAKAGETFDLGDVRTKTTRD